MGVAVGVMLLIDAIIIWYGFIALECYTQLKKDQRSIIHLAINSLLTCRHFTAADVKSNETTILSPSL